MSDDSGDAPMDVAEALRNVVLQLQEDPRRYKLFGVWWWPLKVVLRAAGYGPDQLYLLGSYIDREQAALVPRAGLQETLRAAFAEQQQNAAYPRPDGRVEDPDGELVTVGDPDAGGL